MDKLSERLKSLADHLLQNPYRDDWVTAREAADLALAVEAFQAAEREYREAVEREPDGVHPEERLAASAAKARLLEVNLG